MNVTTRQAIRFVAIILVSSAGAAVLAQQGAPNGEWPSFGGDRGNTKHSPLDQIDRHNFTDLEVAWSWETISEPIARENERVRRGQFKVTPLMVDGLVYVSTTLSQPSK